MHHFIQHSRKAKCVSLGTCRTCVLCLNDRWCRRPDWRPHNTGYFPTVGNPMGGQCLQRNCCQDHPKVTQQKVSPWIGFYWPRMGSSLTSGGRLRRNTPCCVCHTCSTAVCAIPVLLDSHGDQSIAMTKQRSDQVCGDTKC